jgi:hypothetical protein
MTLRIEQGKGRRDRYAMLSPVLLLANPVRRENLAKVRGLLHVVPAASTQPDDTGPALRPAFICRHCGAPMIVIEVLQRSAPIRAPPAQRAAA